MASALERLRKARQGSGTSLASVNISTGTAGNGASGGSALARLRAARAGSVDSGKLKVESGSTGNTGVSGGSALARLRAARAAQAQAQLTPAARLYASEEEKNKQEERDNGGWLGGVGYVAEKAGLGFLQTFEGAVDWTTALVADLFGADDTAEWIMENDWVDYGHADEWFNPSEAWRVAGDVAGGIGTSLAGVGVGLAVSAIPGGAAVAPGLALGVMGLGAAGTSTKEAYMESGKLGLEEFAYGGAMGLVEAGTEWLSGGLGAGVTKAIGVFTKSAGKTATALTLKSFAKDMGKEFLSEAFEEGFSTWISPYVKRATYDPNAKNATAEEILYAGFVGGLSGLAMGGGRVGVTQIMNRADGGTAVREGRVSSIMDTAKAFSDYEGAHPTKLSSMEAVRDLYTRLEAQGVREAAKLTGEQRRALGELQTLTTSAVFESPMQKSALSAIAGAEAIAEKLNADGNIKMVDGKMQSVTPESIAELQKEGAEVRDITAEDIRAGVDAKNGKSVAKAMQKNDLLRYIVASDVAGRFMMTANEVEAAARAGTKIKSQADLNAFIENASDEQKHALGAELGIADSEWATMSLKRFNQAAAAYRESGKLEQRRAEMKAAEQNKNAYAGEAVGETVDSGKLTVESAADVAKTLKIAEKSPLTSINQENMQVSGGKNVRFSIDNGKVIVDTDQNIFEGADRKDYGKIARNYMREHFRGKTVEDAEFTKVSEREYTSSRATQSLYKKSDGVYDTKMKASTELDNMLRVAKKIGHEDAKHSRDFNQKGYDRYEVEFSLNGNEFRGELLVAVNKNGRRTFYDIVKIKRSDSPVSAGLAERGTNASSKSVLPSAKVIAVVESKAPWKTLSSNSISQKSDLSTQNSENSSEKSSKEKIAELKERIDKKKIDAYCRENIEEYASMSAANQSMIRQVVREGRVYGLDDADILSYARVAARSGLNIVYDENLDAKGIAGAYDPKNNRIVVNPKAEKRQELILIHELDHAIRAYLGDDGKIHYIGYKGAEQRLSKETRDFVRGKEYSEQKIDVSREELFADEASAYYTEAILGPKVTIDMLLGKEPSLAKKILNFFTGAARAYSKDAKLSKEARAHYRRFKKMFDDFAKWNQGRNAETAVESVSDGKAKRYNLDEKLGEQLNEWLTNGGKKGEKYNGLYFTLGTTPDVFVKHGAQSVEMIMYDEVVAKVTGMKGDEAHVISLDEIAKLPSQLNDPILLFKGSIPNSFVALTEIVDKQGHDVVVAVHINRRAGRSAITKIASLYSKTNEYGQNRIVSYINNQINNGNLIDASAKKALKWFTTRGLQLPKVVQTIINANNSISQNEDLSTDSAKKVSENSDKISKSARKSGDFEAKLSDDSDKVTISKGQAQKLAANYNSDRVYDKKDVVKALRGIDGFANLPEDMQKELLRDVWVGLNSRYGKGARETFVEVISNKIPYMLLTEAYTEENAKEYGRLQSAKKRAKKTLEGEALKEKLEAIDRELEKLENVPDRLFDTYEQSRIDEINREIAEALNKLLDGGKPSLRSKIEGEFDASDAGKWKKKYIEAEFNETSAEKWKTKYYEARGRAKKLLNLSYQVQKMRDLKLGTFLNATDYKNEIFRETFDILGSINFRGNISPKTVRRAMARLAEWYAPDNPVLAEIDGQPGTRLFSDYIAIEINNIASGEGELSMHELDMLDNILRHATNIVENFNRVWKDGKWVEADKTAKAMIEVADETNMLRRSGDMRRLGKRLGRWFKKYTTTFADPMTLFRYMDGYGNGFWTQMGEELRRAAFRHGVDLMEMKADYDAFNNGHKKYVKNASREVVEYGGAKMTKLQFMSLYMTMHRDQAARGLAENGFSFIDTDGNRVEVEGFLSRVQGRLGSEAGIKKSSDGVWEVSDEQMKSLRESEISEMKKLLSDEDLEYIGIIERTLNGRCKELKTSRDMERLGFSNTISGYYYPIVRAMIAQNIDKRGMWGELDRASNISANKNTVKGAAGALWIESCDTVFNRHIDAVARYAELSPVIDTINKLFNLDVSGNKNKPRSIRTATFNSWQTGAALGAAQSDAQKHNGEAYLKELLSDVQGIGRERSVGGQLVENLRGGFAISALAGNPKVLMTQLSSVFASMNILSKSSLMMGIGRGFGKDVGAELDKYCPVAKLRNYDSAAAKAQGVLDEVRGVGEFLMRPIGFMDRQVVKMLWGAAQVEAEKTTKHKIGTEENKVEAGKILERVIFETQQNSVATEKSAAMRSTNMLMRSLTMFTSDAMKGVGRVIDAFGEVSALKARIRRLRAEVGGATSTSEARVAFSQELQAWFDSTSQEERAKSGKRFFVGKSSDVLKSIGVKDYDIYIGGSKINKILEGNEAMSLDIVKQAIKLLDDPMLIMESKTVEDSIVVFGEVYAKDGKPVMLSLLLSPKNKNGEILDYAVVTSAYGRRPGNLQNLINTSKIYYVCDQKNRTDAWLKALGLQLPSALTKLGSINSITENGENVNSEAKKSKDEQLKSLEAQLKNAKAQARRSVGALAMTALYMTLIARAFSWLYKKEEDEEDKTPLAFVADVFGGMLGGLPIISDVYDFFVSGYDLSDNVYDTMNGVLQGVSKVTNTAGKLIAGEATAADMNGATISAMQSIGTVLGLPIRNVRNMVMGLTRRFNPNAAYRLEMLSEAKNFASDFEEAINAGDEEKAAMILEMLLAERLAESDTGEAGGMSAELRGEILRMSGLGYNILPRTIGSTVTIAGEDIETSAEEQAALRARYSEATGSIDTLIASEAYQALSDEEKEKAVRFVYDVYYDTGISELYGYERNLKRRLFSKVISPEKLALASVMTAGLESDYEDSRGQAVSLERWATIKGTAARVNYSAVQGSKRKKVIAAINKLPLTTAEKLLIIAYKGYTIKDGDIRGISAARAKQMLSRYARGQGFSADEAKALLEYL